MLIKGANVYCDGKFIRRDIAVSGEIFTVYSNDDVVKDYSDAYIIPGLTDIHFHGAVGKDLCDGTKESIEAICEYEAQNGVTQVIPATMTLADDELERIFKAIGEYDGTKGAEFIGVHMEGPYISKDKIGAQNPKYLAMPSLENFDKYQKLSNNRIKKVTIAPEVDGAKDFIKERADEVVISIGHTDCDYDTALEAFDLGAKSVTHLFNALNDIKHRSPGVCGAAFDSPEVMVELITDGVHIHPSVIRMIYAMFGDDRVILISDSMMATGLSDGKYSLGGQDVYVKGKKATLESGTIAGSASNLFDCIRYAYSIGIPFESLVRSAAVNSAKEAGIYDKYGSIRVGKYANFVVVDKDLNIIDVYIRGKKIGELNENN